MERIPSEVWFQRTLEEATVALDPSSSSSSSSNPPPPPAAVEMSSNTEPFAAPDLSESYLRKQLDRACAAFAIIRGQDLSKEGGEKDGGTAALEISAMQNVSINDHDDDDKVEGEELDLAAADNDKAKRAKKRLANSDKVEGEELDLAAADDEEAKLAKKRLANREAARRSRNKKKAIVVDIETQVSKLTLETSRLTNHLTNLIQKYNEAAVEYQVLKASVEIMAARVKMAEQKVYALFQLNLLPAPVVAAIQNDPTLQNGLFQPTFSPLFDTDAVTVGVQGDPAIQNGLFQPTLSPLIDMDAATVPLQDGPVIPTGVLHVPRLDHNVQHNHRSL